LRVTVHSVRQTDRHGRTDERHGITNYAIMDFEMDIAILATLKISDWLTD